MGIIKEPLEVDFYTEPKGLTEKEKKMISEHIRHYKEKMEKSRKRRVNRNVSSKPQTK